MSQGGPFVAQAHAQAERLGHEIVWDEVGRHVAHGHCVKCEMTLTAASPDGVSTTLGTAAQAPCPMAGGSTQAD